MKELVTLAIGDIHPYERNPRKNEAAIPDVKESIVQAGYIAPIIVDENNEILAGHTRYAAMQDLGKTEIEVMRVTGMTEAQKKKYRLLDNKTAEKAAWDYELLDWELSEVDFEGYDFGFTFPDDKEKEPDIKEDEAPQEAESRTKERDIWQLGRHRLMCGDSTDAEHIKRLIGEAKIDLLLTDPPYGVNIVSSATSTVGGGGAVKFGKAGGGKIVQAKTYKQIKGDSTTDTARLSYEIAKAITSNQIIFGGNYFTDFLPPHSCWCVWDKENTGNFADVELAWTSFDKAAKLYKHMWNGLCREGDRNVEGKTRVHPTQKPVGMLSKIINDFSEAQQNILDTFGGSGSTLMACEQTDRNCYMMEYETSYCDVIIQRWENLTGETAKLIERVN